MRRVKIKEISTSVQRQIKDKEKLNLQSLSQSQSTHEKEIEKSKADIKFYKSNVKKKLADNAKHLLSSAESSVIKNQQEIKSQIIEENKIKEKIANSIKNGAIQDQESVQIIPANITIVPQNNTVIIASNFSNLMPSIGPSIPNNTIIITPNSTISAPQATNTSSVDFSDFVSQEKNKTKLIESSIVSSSSVSSYISKNFVYMDDSNNYQYGKHVSLTAVKKAKKKSLLSSMMSQI